MMTGTVQRLDGSGSPLAGAISSGWSVTHSHATQATATKAAVAGAKHVITGFIVSSDKAGATCIVKQGTTTKLTFAIAAAEAFAYSLPSFLELDVGEAATVTIDGTAACSANLLGFTLNPL